MALVDHGRFVLAAPLVADWRPGRRVVTTGESYFLGATSPDARHALVLESRGDEGYMDVAGVDGRLRSLGAGYLPAWAGPTALVFEVLAHDGWRVTRADLWVVDVVTGARRPLLESSEALEGRPAVSPDGRRLAYVDERDGTLHVTTLRWEGGRP